MSSSLSRLGPYVARRLVQVVPVGLALLTTAFVMVHLAPGDPLLLLAGDGGTPEYYADMRARYGLDQPLAVQFGRYVAGVVRGEFGYSFSYQRPVAGVVAERLPATLLLGGAATMLGVTLGVALAVSGARRGGWTDRLVRAVTATTYALPVFWLGQLLLLLFAFELNLLPVAGMASARTPQTGLAAWRDLAAHLVLPASSLGLSFAALIARVARHGLLDALDREFARAAIARGVSRSRLLWRHALPNALLPVITVTGHHAGMLLSSAALIESLFAWPGIGRLLIDASLQRDTPLALAIVALGFAMVVLANLVTDVLYAVADPRVELT